MLSSALEDFSRISEVLPIPPSYLRMLSPQRRISNFAGMAEEREVAGAG